MRPLLTIALLLAGCSMSNPPSREDGEKALNAIRYVRDSRTGLCFAMLGSRTSGGYQVFSIATVPLEACK